MKTLIKPIAFGVVVNDDSRAEILASCLNSFHNTPVHQHAVVFVQALLHPSLRIDDIEDGISVRLLSSSEHDDIVPLAHGVQELVKIRAFVDIKADVPIVAQLGITVNLQQRTIVTPTLSNEGTIRDRSE